jgi:peptide/nickel transport system substrate-binding protein
MTILAVRSVDNRGLMFPTVADTGKKTARGYPIGNNVTSDPAIRKAVTLAIDRQRLVDGVLEGFGRPAYGVCDNLPWDNPANAFKDNDPKGAAALLDQAGWVDADRDGIREKNGLRAEFSIIYPANRSERQYLALAVFDTLKKIGIKVSVEQKPDFDEIQKVMHSNVVVFGWGAHDPMVLCQLYNTTFAGVEYNNVGFYSNPLVDESISAMGSWRSGFCFIVRRRGGGEWAGFVAAERKGACVFPRVRPSPLSAYESDRPGRGWGDRGRGGLRYGAHGHVRW